ncbi:MAG: four helix bundle protein [Flavobacteriales bacterium]|jgi:four helix bundle protein
MHKLSDLQVWVKARGLAKEIYLITGKLPDAEKFGLISQMRRAAVSVASNIAEGAGRNSDKEFIRFLAIAFGSSYEIKTQLLICVDLGFLDEKEVDQLLSEIDEVERMIWGLQKAIKSRLNQ